MGTMVADLLALARVSRGGWETAPVSLEDALEEAVANLRAELDESRAEVSWDDLPVVEGDRAQLVRLFQNLLGNAIKYRGEDAPRVHVAVTREEPPEISVRDNGAGFDPDQAQRIFEPFDRLDRGNECPGTGLGLAICRRITERHGGRIEAEGRPGQGATFRVTLRSP
jgi:signal transduction histidine kinase